MPLLPGPAGVTGARSATQPHPHTASATRAQGSSARAWEAGACSKAPRRGAIRPAIGVPVWRGDAECAEIASR